MKHQKPFLSKSLAVAVAVITLFSAASSDLLAQDQVLNYRDADIRAFIDDVTMLTGRAFIVDPRVQGQVTVISRDPVQPEQVFQVLLSTLRVNGFAVVPTASGAYKIIPEESAAQAAGPVGINGEAGDTMVTEVFRLQNLDGPTAMRSIQPIVNPEGRAIANPGNNYLIVVDFAGNMRRIREVVAEIDLDRSEVETVQLENTSAGEMAEIVADLSSAGSQGEGGRPSGVRAVPVESSNTLLLRGERAALDGLMPIIRRIDAQNADRGDLRVIYLKHAEAEKLVPLLEQVSRTIGSVIDAGDGVSTLSDQSRASIAFHEETNALVINAEPDMLKALEGVIHRLDIRRLQVLVEAIIAEVTDDTARELGLQYVLSGSEGSNVPFTATNFSNTAPNILAATGAIVVDQQTEGSSEVVDDLRQAAVNSLLGINGFTGGFAGITDNGTLFGLILTALDQDTSSNVLSTPSIMTMDNEAASIIVGQEIPITTGEVLGADNANPFRTVERQDVGIQLDVQPQINEGNTVKLFIRQEVSSILGPVSTVSQELILSKREIETTVTVDDGEIIVLGGLIEDDEQVSIDKVPLLGDIPFLGRLFRSEGKSRRKTNLMIFLRPTIIRSVDDARSVTDRKYNLIRAEQLLRGGGDEPQIDRMMREVIGGAENLPIPEQMATEPQPDN